MDKAYRGGGSTMMKIKMIAKQLTKPEVLKYIIAGIILIYIVILLIFTSGSTKSFSEVRKKVEKAISQEELQQESGQKFKRYYGLNAADYEGVMLYSAKSSMSAEEILLVKTKTDEQVKEVERAIEKRLEKRMLDFEGYAPEQVRMLEQAQISVRGKFVLCVVSPKVSVYVTAFSKAL